MPATRRSSISSVSSASSRQSFPATINSSTKVTKGKVETIMTRRKQNMKRKMIGPDKENAPIRKSDRQKGTDSKSILQSPTPYWKVAEERGTTTPPETRSTKKRKISSKKLIFSPKEETSETKTGVFLFSPPDQKANILREKQELERKKKDKDRRVQQARDNGQLLVFSPTFRNPAQLPKSRENETFELFSSQLEELSKRNSELEDQNEKMSATLKTMQSDIEKERSVFEAQDIEMNQELKKFKVSSEKRINELLKEKKKLSIELRDRVAENSTMKNSINELESNLEAFKQELEECKQELEESKELHSTLKSEFDVERNQLLNDCESLQKLGSDKQKAYDDMVLEQTQLKEALAAHKGKIDDLETIQLPELKAKLGTALEDLSLLQEELARNREQIKTYEQEIGELKGDLELLKKDQAEERDNFQALNEETSKAYESITNNLREKEELIDKLKGDLVDINQLMESEKAKSEEWSEKVKQLKMEMKTVADEFEDTVSEERRKLKKAEDEIQTLKGQANDINHKLQNEKSNQTNILERSEKVTKDNEYLQQKIRELQSANEKLMMKNANLSEQERQFIVRLQEGDAIRRALHNKVMQLSGNIRVFVRVRPLLQNESMGSSDNSPFTFPGVGDRPSESTSCEGGDDLTKNLLQMTEPYKDRGGLSERRKKWTFAFDNVFNSQHGQEDVWDATEPLVQSTIDGYNVTLFAYGQTGSGKTFTMLGNKENPGILSRSISKLFLARDQIAELSCGKSEVQIAVELLEVYNEKVRDLLAVRNGSQVDEKGLQIKANEAVGSTVLDVSTEDEVSDILRRAQKLRCVKATASNAESSRSHLLFTLHFAVKTAEGPSRVGKLHICDLAGSERLSKSQANAVVGSSLMKETKHINTSLSTLSNVIEKLQAGDAKVPFRDSKLTYLLQNSLGGNSKTLAIVCCNPLQNHFHESLCSLRFASKVNRVDLKAVANVQV